MWVRAMYSYDSVAKNIGPKKEALAQAEGELRVVQRELGKKQDALQKVRSLACVRVSMCVYPRVCCVLVQG